MRRQSPVMLQYDRIKAQYREWIVLIRIGDFYEAFDDDAQVLSDTCGTMLTGRPYRNKEKRLMSGVPWHVIDSHVKELTEAGYKVAVADQMGEPVKGVIPREVTREETP